MLQHHKGGGAYDCAAVLTATQNSKKGHKPMRVFDFLDPSLIDKDEVFTAGYRVYDVFTNRRGMPVVVQMSNTAEPYHWYVQDGTSSIFFLTYAEVAAYIRRRGLVPGSNHTNQSNRRF